MATWVKGQSGNPDGRPRRGRRVSELIRTIAAEKVTFTDPGGAGDAAPEVSVLARRERLARVLWTMALDGNLAAVKLLLEYMEGRPTSRVETQPHREVRFSADTLARAEARLLESLQRPAGGDRSLWDLSEVDDEEA